MYFKGPLQAQFVLKSVGLSVYSAVDFSVCLFVVFMNSVFVSTHLKMLKFFNSIFSLSIFMTDPKGEQRLPEADILRVYQKFMKLPWQI